MKRSLAFTLAEVIIVIGIIGMVAEMTIPMLVASYKKDVTITQLKKVVSMINSANQSSIAEYRYLNAYASEAAPATALKDYFLPSFKVIKSCESSESDCGLTDFWCLHGLDKGLAMSATDKRYIMADGTFIGFKADGEYKIFVDINGKKTPNKIGYDVFIIRITPTNGQAKINTWYSPSYFDGDLAGCQNFTQNGSWCFNRVMYDNWQLNYWQ